jgi:hypothetical protein
MSARTAVMILAIALAAGLLITGAGGGADVIAAQDSGGEQSSEPNDDFDTATKVSDGGAGRINNSQDERDYDFYQVELEAGDALRVEHTGGENYTLYGPDRQELAATSFNGLDKDFVATGAVIEDSGTHYIRVGSSLNGFYSFEIVTSTPDRFEPNDQPGEATPIEYDETYNATLFRENDDLYAVQAEKGEVIRGIVDRSDTPGSEIGQDFAIEILDTEGERVGQIGANFGRGTPSNFTESLPGIRVDQAYQRARATEAGTYYVRVRGLARPSIAGFVDYEVRASLTECAYPLSGDDEDLPLDPDGDGVCEDVTGTDGVGIVDVQRLFVIYDGLAGTDNSRAFDFNGDETVDVVDVQALFAEL